MGRPRGFFVFSKISGRGKEHFRRFSGVKQKACLVNETQRRAVISNIGRRPTSPLTASLVALRLTPRTNLQRCRLSFSTEWGSSIHFTEWLLAQVDFEMKYGPQTSMPYVMTGNTSRSNNDIVNWARWDVKMSSYQYRKSHCEDKTVVRSSYLHNGISYAGKMSSLYWTNPQFFC